MVVTKVCFAVIIFANRTLACMRALCTPYSKFENIFGKELTRNLSGNIRPQSSQLAEPLWTDHGINSGICVFDLISTKKKKKSVGGE